MIYLEHSETLSYVQTDSVFDIFGSTPIASSKTRRSYPQSFFNLAATVSRTSNEGLFRHRTPSDINPCFLDLRYNEWHAGVFHCVEAHYWENNVDCNILNTRAWTLQEMWLVPWILVFLSDQIFWRCESLLASEIDSIGMHDEYPEYTNRLQLTSGPSAWGSRGWFDIVEGYTSR